MGPDFVFTLPGVRLRAVVRRAAGAQGQIAPRRRHISSAARDVRRSTVYSLSPDTLYVWVRLSLQLADINGRIAVVAVRRNGDLDRSAAAGRLVRSEGADAEQLRLSLDKPPADI
jgi:hypothetical protein